MGDLEIGGLTKRYGDNPVVNDVSFSVAEGEFFVLLGPSGGGKSTLLRLICGLERPDAGRIALAGREITHLQPRERNIGMVFQDYGLYPHMNTFQNIAYGLEARRMPRREVERRVAEAAEKLDLIPLLERSIVDLSGGEQQRVALARALARDADLYLFDEPLSNLDPKLRSRARGDVLLLHRQKQRPSVYVTHDQTEAMAIGDRIGIIAGGRMRQIGRAEELIADPANLFVAGFIGSPPMNLVPGSLAVRGEGYVVRADGLELRLPQRWQAPLAAHAKERVVLGLPPGGVVLEGAPGPVEVGPDNLIAGRVEEIEPLIGETVVTLRAGKATSLAVVFAEIDADLAVGDTLRLGVDPDQLRLFDPETEQALPLS